MLIGAVEGIIPMQAKPEIVAPGAGKTLHILGDAQEIAE
jgi:hypothetical protein